MDKATEILIVAAGLAFTLLVGAALSYWIHQERREPRAREHGDGDASMSAERRDQPNDSMTAEHPPD